MGTITIAHEFDILYREGNKTFEDGVSLPKKSFDNLWQYILESSNNEVEQVMTVHTRGGRRFIKTGRYVGTIQTRDGHTIEILPKIYKASSGTLADVKLCRKVFLQMLRHFTDRRAKTFQNATLEAKEGFPILEAYISNYLKELETLLVVGLRKNYSTKNENQKFLKGRLLVSKHIAKNSCDKTKFFISYNKYIHDIPQNRIIVSTLHTLSNISHSSSNRMRINELLTMLADVPQSTNIESDLIRSKGSNRLFAAYEQLIQWSEQFLRGRGFTTFSGNCVNQSLLFSAERLFEDFVAYLFKKYSRNCSVSAQHKKYFLVDKHRESGMFQLRPDIFVESDNNALNYGCVIIDTKWKTLDSSRIDKQYFIDMKDIYQLYAYGQKYRNGYMKENNDDIVPQLVLLYPSTEKFSNKLDDFIYDDILHTTGLSLMVVPFDLSDPESYESQIVSIIKSLNVKKYQRPVYMYNEYATLVAEPSVDEYIAKKPLMLVGCYKNANHLNWIKEHSLYNIRFGERKGAAQSIISAQRLLLYNANDINEYYVYNLDPIESKIADYETMAHLDYPNLKHNRRYILYKIKEQVESHSVYDVKAIKGDKGNIPMFVEY
jgi:5-methylcytosine-specific restriction enzyme subunit McrC